MNATALIRLTSVGLRLTLASALTIGAASCSGSLKDNEDLVGLEEETLPPPVEGGGG